MTRHITTGELSKARFRWIRAGDEPYDYIEAVTNGGEAVAILNSNIWPEDDWKLWELTKLGEELFPHSEQGEKGK